jgi:hypothetical protein
MKSTQGSIVLAEKYGRLNFLQLKASITIVGFTYAMATAEDNIHLVLIPEIEFQLSGHVSLIGTCARRLVKTPLFTRRKARRRSRPLFPLSLMKRSSRDSKGIATRRAMLAAVQRTGVARPARALRG